MSPCWPADRGRLGPLSQPGGAVAGAAADQQGDRGRDGDHARNSGAHTAAGRWEARSRSESGAAGWSGTFPSDWDAYALCG